MLSDHLFISKLVDLETGDCLQTPNTIGLLSPNSRARTNFIFENDEYRNSNIDTVIKLLLRCRILYQAMHEVMKILQLIIKQEGIFEKPTGPLFALLNKYENLPNLKLSLQDESAVIKGF